MKKKMKKRFRKVKTNFGKLPLAEKVFDILMIVAMIGATLHIALTDPDSFMIIQLTMNIAATLTLFLTQFLFSDKSLFGSMSMSAQKYINFIVLFGSFGGQYLASLDVRLVDFDGYDTWTHVLTGCVVCFLGYHIFEHYSKKPAYENPTFCSVFSFFFSMTGALFWEVFEFSSDFLTGSHCQGYNLSLETEKFFYYRWFTFAVRDPQQYALYDTFADIFAALLTATITCIIMAKVLKRIKAKKEATETAESKEEITA